MTFVFSFPAAGLVLSHYESLHPPLLKYNNSDRMPHLRLVSSSVVKERATTPRLYFFLEFSRHSEWGKRRYDTNKVEWYVHVQWTEQSKVMNGRIVLE
jgi:hypothetical protein